MRRLFFLFALLPLPAFAQIFPPQLVPGDSYTLPYSPYIIGSGNYPYPNLSYGVGPTNSGGSLITDGNAGFGAKLTAITNITRCVTTDGSTPTGTGGTCSHGTTISGSGTLTITGNATVQMISTEAAQTTSGITTTTLTFNPFWPLAGTFAYGVAPVLTCNQGGNCIYTTNGSTPTVSGTCASATNGTVIANGTAIPALSSGTTTVKSAPCSGSGTLGSVQTATYVVRTAQNWFVRADGGTRFSAAVPTGQCNGQFDASYASTGGSGTNQNCAYNDVRYLWDDDSRSGGLGAWVIAGGDTAVVRGCHALATQSNPSNPNCRIGWDQNNGGGGNSWCFAVGNQGCTNPPIPMGNSAHHTVIEGGCAFDGNCTPVKTYPYTSNLAQIFAGFGLQYSFNLTNTAYVDVAGIELTTHNGTCSHGYSPGYPAACNTSTPDDFADNGFFTNNFSTNITFTNIYEHGFNSAGFFGPIGGPVTNTNVIQAFNGFAGQNFNDNSTTPNWPTASLTEHYVWREGNGCTEQYPIVNTTFPALGCWDSSSGGFGDAISGQDSNVISYIADHLTTIYNTKDGTMGPHFAYQTASVTNSTWYGNMGQQHKWGGQVGATLLVQNNLIMGNCTAMSTTLPGAAQNFNQSTGLGGSYLTNFCRAGGNVIDVLEQAGGSAATSWYGNTIIENGTDGMLFDCGPAGGGFTNCGSITNTLKDNIFLGYTNPAFGGPSPTIYSVQAGSNIVLSPSFEVAFGMAGITGCGSSGIICSSPLLTSQPAQPWPGDSAFFGFNFLPTGGSPAVAAGTAVAGLTTDFNGTTRPNPPSDGALEQGAVTLVSITVLPNPGSISLPGTLNMQTSSFCTFSDSSTVAAGSTGCVVVWTDTNAHSSINASTGVVTGVSVGSDTITATLSPATPATATVNMSISPPTSLKGVTIIGGTGMKVIP